MMNEYFFERLYIRGCGIKHRGIRRRNAGASKDGVQEETAFIGGKWLATLAFANPMLRTLTTKELG